MTALQTVEKLIFEVVLRVVIKRLLAALPFLLLPVINPIFVFAMEKLGGLFQEVLTEYVSLKVIKFETVYQQAQYEIAVSRLHTAIESNDESEKEKAKKVFKERLANLIHFTIN